MKKYFSLVIAALLVLAALTGCSGTKPDVEQTPPPAPTATQPTGGGSTTGAPNESFSAYLDLKSRAFDLISAKIEEHDELALNLGLTLLPLAMTDLALLPLAFVGLEEDAANMGLATLGLSDIKIAKNGDVYTVTYQDEEGGVIVQTCEYDAVTDSMRSIITTDGKEQMTFEYTKVGSGYISQYFMASDDGDSLWMTNYFTADTYAFGMKTTSEKPASIFKKADADITFVQNDELYAMHENGVLTLVEAGETKTY